MIAYYASPEDSTIRKSIREAPAVAASIPDRTKQLMDQLRNRLEQAKETFRGAKVESETSLVRQLNDAKRRGSVGPVLG